MRANDLHQHLGRGAAIAERHLLGGGQGSAARADHLGAIDVRHAVADLAHGLEQLRRDQQVERARHRRQAEHRRAAVQFGVGPRVDLDVVGGRAGALRNARDRRALHAVAGMDGGVDQPLGKHPSAFAAERADEEGDGAIQIHPATRGSALQRSRSLAAPFGRNGRQGSQRTQRTQRTQSRQAQNGLPSSWRPSCLGVLCVRSLLTESSTAPMSRALQASCSQRRTGRRTASTKRSASVGFVTTSAR